MCIKVPRLLIRCWHASLRAVALCILRWVTWLQRRHGTIVGIWKPGGRIFIAALFDDAVEVLRRNDALRVPFGPSMKELGGGRNFILGMDDSPEYRRDLQMLREAVLPEDWTAFLGRAVEEETAAVLKDAKGEIDVVDGYFKLVMGRLFARYFGVPIAEPLNWATWGSHIFAFNFADFTKHPEIRERAEAGAKAARSAILANLSVRMGQIRAGNAAGMNAQEVLSRMALQYAKPRDGLADPQDIAVNVIGMLNGYVVPTCIISPQVVDYILDQPDAMRSFLTAVHAKDDPQLAKCIFEGTRFRPMAPIIPRTAKHAVMLAADTPRARTIPAGATVLAAVESAMNDPRRVGAPGDFDPNRPLGIYLHEGYGLHTCFGKYLNPLQLPALFRPLLERGIYRLPGRAGALSVDIAGMPRRLNVKLGPPVA